ncbi:caspase-8 [Aricia agestis]|uniref:caspase-8 n=1 Tax=Aricia agestis TaxID=91739 RepID=UPI001C206E1A|nr:caspase-8 [Aricia agestis]
MSVLYSDHNNEDFFQKSNSINTESILSIQKDVEPYDMISLVFLLYDTPDTALQRLIVYDRIHTDVSDDNLNLLYDWALHSQKRPTWKYEFLEALATCRLYNIIRQLGFNVSNVKKYYLPENTSPKIYINPIKKVLYRLCEHITQEEFGKLKDTLMSYDVKFTDHKTCELLLLDLMCQKFIKVPEYDKQKRQYTQCADTKNLSKILDYFSNLKPYALQLRKIENNINNANLEINRSDTCASEPKIEDNIQKENLQKSDMNEVFDELNTTFCMVDDLAEYLKSDTQLSKDTYPIKNKARIGVCCIINQEYFHLSKRNMELGLAQEALDNRHGSAKDLQALETTMSAFKFKVISGSNLDHKETILFIKDVIKQILPNDSVFMLCILSHGVRGHVYASDCVKIRVADIQNILDSDEAVTLHGIPKVMILQACQVNDDMPTPKMPLVADGPSHLKKSHFLIYWATAPEYEAFRHEQGGSLFIQFLCGLLKKKGRSEQLSDIFTKVTDHVTTLCARLEKAQVPIFESTLRKKLYLFPLNDEESTV